MHLLPPIQIPHLAQYAMCPSTPYPTQQTMRQAPQSQEPAANKKISQSQITIKQFIVSHQVSPTPTDKAKKKKPRTGPKY